MASNLPTIAAATARSAATTTSFQEKHHRSVFELSPSVFDSCYFLPSTHSSIYEPNDNDRRNVGLETPSNNVVADGPQDTIVSAPRWTCNTCKAQFDSLQDQRSHFKSDIHRFNVKLTVAGKNIVKEEDFEVLTSEFVKDYDVSSISGSESDSDSENESQNRNEVRDKSREILKQKLFVGLQSGQSVSLWKCLIMNMSDENGSAENEVCERLKSLTLEPRDNSHLRIVLLASGGHFAGCVFDGDAVVAHKTFHRYVVRAKAGKKQSSKDASGRAAHSAGASLRRHNELALKKEVQELLTSWRPYFDASKCIFINAPSSSRQLFYNGEKSLFSNPHCAIRNIPFTVRRPTFREAKRVYSQLTQVSFETDEKETLQSNQEGLISIPTAVRNTDLLSSKGDMIELDNKDEAKASSSKKDAQPVLSDEESENELPGISTPLHQAAKSGDAHNVMELLEQGLDPCIKDERGRTPYMLANEKEVRNIFRRFMASNPDKWDWHAAKVPSALTKEMEESQAAKQAEKEAKRKARAKELKKLKKAKEKRAQAEAALLKNDSKAAEKQMTAPASSKGQSQSKSGVKLSKEEEIRRAQAEEREKRAAAAERRIAALKIQENCSTSTHAISEPKGGLAGEIYCSCCNSSLAGKVPFHRYNYNYCSTSCMHVHREFLEDG
ncbi:hypothetical protein HN51_011595 [Arachis hypogaea]|uniref:VLRF1 domain-containing protein n=1 Tax=Arachis hypogaea TaxID=3818 RepID=A0A445DYB9_ARAHY|nr:ankyrin repeat and zinc finger domain-containing protein 1 [Arachis hypogaea]QHO56921.1 Ankyrin repeat and zinc finger domain-containing protein [Arachis hypogaea]RYR68208.1 hypothetical protein Ahy_A03g014690 isoform B [Arachis hypogaea]